jgi:precorrin-6B methylase 2
MNVDVKASSTPSFARIHDLYWAFAPTFMVHAAARVGLFDAVEKQPRDLADLARHTQTSERGMSRLANGLVGLGLLSRDANGRYGLTPESATYLVSSRPETNWSGLFKAIDVEILAAWQHLAESVRTGKPPSSQAHNREENSGDFFAESVEGILPMSWSAAEALAQHLSENLGPRTQDKTFTALDVAAGSGAWGVPLALHMPKLRVTAVDWPPVLEVTRRTATRHAVVDRFTFTPGNIDEVDFGTGYQFAVLGHIVHAVGEARSRALMKKTFAALVPGGTIVVPEFIMNEDRSGPMTSVYFSMSMLVQSDDGAAFSLRELCEWLREAGFTDMRLLEAPAPSPLILATKPF